MKRFKACPQSVNLTQIIDYSQTINALLTDAD